MNDFGGDDDWDAEGNDFDSLAVDADLGDDGVGDYENTTGAEDNFDLNTLESETHDFSGSGTNGISGHGGEVDGLLESRRDDVGSAVSDASTGFWWVRRRRSTQFLLSLHAMLRLNAF